MIFYDWQVTIGFYTALHLVNAHLAKYGLHYRSHNAVKDALNPENQVSLTKLPEDEYVSYVALQMLSRRSRYLVNEKSKEEVAHFTFEKHLSKALRHLDILLNFFNSKYKLNIEKQAINCSDLNPANLKILIKL